MIPIHAWAILLLFAFFIAPADLRGITYMTREEALEIAFPGADSVGRKIEVITQAKRERIESLSGKVKVPAVFSYYAGFKEGKVMGYAVIEDVIGKSEPITFMVLADPGLSVHSVEILAYREPQGGEIRQEGFRRQFVGKSVRDPLRLDSDIRNVSGATISCRSLTDGVRAIMACLTILVGTEGVGGGKRGKGGGMPLWEEGSRACDRHTFSSHVSVSGQTQARRARLLMGTLLEITVYSADAREALASLSGSFEEVSRLENLMSTFVEESEVSRLNRSGGKGPIEVSPDLVEIIGLAGELSWATGGAFDITVAPLLSLWEEAKSSGRLPGKEEREEARSRVGMGLLERNTQMNCVRLLKEGMEIDLGGIGKGYALDRVLAILKSHGIRRALLNFGGNILAMGSPADAPWEIGIRDPLSPGKCVAALRLAGGAVSTSADYERGIEIGGTRYSHIIDPRTGEPARGLLSVTVIDSSAARADALSTALYVMGREGALRFAEEHSIAALIVREGNELLKSRAFLDIEKENRGER